GRRVAGRAAEQVRAGHQPQDRQGARPDDSALAACTGGSGDRVVQRRAFIGVLTSGLLAAPLAAEAQEPGKVPRIGVLGTNPPGASNSFPSFRKALQELGYVEGQNVRLEYRWPDSGREAYPTLAAQLVQNRVDVILTISSAPALAAKRATDTLPIVFCALGD